MFLIILSQFPLMDNHDVVMKNLNHDNIILFQDLTIKQATALR